MSKGCQYIGWVQLKGHRQPHLWDRLCFVSKVMFWMGQGVGPGRQGRGLSDAAAEIATRAPREASGGMCSQPTAGFGAGSHR
jgi:hypothetical protein